MESIKHDGDVYISGLYKLIKCIWNTEQVPKDWQKGVVMVIHKREIGHCVKIIEK